LILENCEVIDLSKRFNKSSFLFKDADHLNSDGAKSFWREFSIELNMLSKYN